jgi:hypothetical protein
MKTKRILKNVAIVTTLFAAISFRSIAASPEAEAQFMTDMKAAFDTKDSKKFISLICWDRVDSEMKKAFIPNIPDLLQEPVAKIELVAPDTNKTNEFTLKGVIYRPNLVVVKQLKIYNKLGNQDETDYLVGEKNGKLFITLAAPIK